MLLVDTNVLLEATDEARAGYREARRLLESPAGLVLASQVIREYLVVATRPRTANGFGLAIREALDNLRELRRAIRVLPEETPVLPTFLELVERTGCSGKRIHDAHLVATGHVHRVEALVSLNVDDLVPLAGTMPVLTPAQALARTPRGGPSGGRARRSS